MTLSLGRMTIPSWSRSRRRGFTLVELLVVIVIIGIVTTLVAAAAISATAQAEKRATQALITKLQTAVADRMEALYSQPIEPNGTHRYLAAITPPGGFQAAAGINPNDHPLKWGLQSEDRARTIARIEFIKMNMPDVFFIQWTPGTSGSYSAPGDAATYPINFAGLPYAPVAGGGTRPYDAAFNPNTSASNPWMVLPIGNKVSPAYIPDLTSVAYAGSALAWQTGPGASTAYPPTAAIATSGFGPWVDGTGTTPDPRWAWAGTGIYGASYAAAAGIYKNLGYLSTGFDGVDNNNNGYVDEWAEGVNATNQAIVLERLGNHRHETARSEMLYALLVEGIGPMGSVFNPGDFTENEVKDTDGDGLPEFVDAWGHPLQFYRWPVFFGNQPLQKGVFDPKTASWTAYGSGEERQRNPLDSGGYLVDPAWWQSNVNVGDGILPLANVCGGAVGGMSGRALAVQAYFGPLSASAYSLPSLSVANNRYAWDLTWTGTASGIAYPRQSYYSKPLILSAGPDGKTGLYGIAEPKSLLAGGATASSVAKSLIGVMPYNIGSGPGENNALVHFDFDLDGNAELDPDGIPFYEGTFDNITNQDLETASGGGLY